MDEYGSLDDATGEFIYDDKYKNLIPIVAIDDITGIHAEVGSSNIRNDNSHLLASKLKEIAKTYNILLILAVPSASTYVKTNYHASSLEEVAPYGMYADRIVILHNPAETEEKNMLGYEVKNFINSRTGICYLRTATIVANYMGPSNISYGYLIYPENGYIKELPASDNVDELDDYIGEIN
jgi:predicted metal-dependent TIM-barrel fold hydrolase